MGFGFGASPKTSVDNRLHSFRMPLFFLISGFFANMMLGKYGTKRYLARRWWRIGAPLAIAIVAFAGLRIAASYIRSAGPPAFGPPAAPFTGFGPAPAGFGAPPGMPPFGGAGGGRNTPSPAPFGGPAGGPGRPGQSPAAAPGAGFRTRVSHRLAVPTWPRLPHPRVRRKFRLAPWPMRYSASTHSTSTWSTSGSCGTYSSLSRWGRWRRWHSLLFRVFSDRLVALPPTRWIYLVHLPLIPYAIWWIEPLAHGLVGEQPRRHGHRDRCDSRPL